MSSQELWSKKIHKLFQKYIFFILFSFLQIFLWLKGDINCNCGDKNVKKNSQKITQTSVYILSHISLFQVSEFYKKSGCFMRYNVNECTIIIHYSLLVRTPQAKSFICLQLTLKLGPTKHKLSERDSSCTFLSRYFKEACAIFGWCSLIACLIC